MENFYLCALAVQFAGRKPSTHKLTYTKILFITSALLGNSVRGHYHNDCPAGYDQKNLERIIFGRNP